LSNGFSSRNSQGILLRIGTTIFVAVIAPLLVAGTVSALVLWRSQATFESIIKSNSEAIREISKLVGDQSRLTIKLETTITHLSRDVDFLREEIKSMKKFHP
jgi:outer membrane murein-binding lipoprotein Lpp